MDNDESFEDDLCAEEEIGVGRRRVLHVHDGRDQYSTSTSRADTLHGLQYYWNLSVSALWIALYLLLHIRLRKSLARADRYTVAYSQVITGQPLRAVGKA